METIKMGIASKPVTHTYLQFCKSITTLIVILKSNMSINELVSIKIIIINIFRFILWALIPDVYGSHTHTHTSRSVPLTCSEADRQDESEQESAHHLRGHHSTTAPRHRTDRSDARFSLSRSGPRGKHRVKKFKVQIILSCPHTCWTRAVLLLPVDRRDHGAVQKSTRASHNTRIHSLRVCWSSSQLCAMTVHSRRRLLNAFSRRPNAFLAVLERSTRVFAAQLRALWRPDTRSAAQWAEGGGPPRTGADGGGAEPHCAFRLHLLQRQTALRCRDVVYSNPDITVKVFLFVFHLLLAVHLHF